MKHIKYLVLLLFIVGVARADLIPMVGFGVSVFTEVASDDFNRANETPMTTNGWTSDVSSRVMDLISNQVHAADVYTAMAWRNTGTYSDDQCSKAQMVAAADASMGGPGVRYQKNGAWINGYYVEIQASGNAEIWVTYSAVDDTWEQVGATYTGGSFSAGDYFTICIKGQVITVYKNNDSTPFLSRTDSNNRVTTGGRPAVVSVTQKYWDNWSGGDFLL